MTLWLWILIALALLPPVYPGVRLLHWAWSWVVMLLNLPFMAWLPPGSFLQRLAVNGFTAADQLGNEALGGDPDDTRSARYGRAVHRGPAGCRACYWIARIICRAIDLVDPDHCERYRRADPSEGRRGLFYRGPLPAKKE